jgi:flagellar biosynthesis protein FlhF
MRLKVYRAATVTQALAQARSELGNEALILATRHVNGAVELTVALERAEPEILAPTAPPADLAILTWHGIPAPIAERLAAGPLEPMLTKLLRFEPLPLGPNGPPLLLAGPPGAGKTLTIARLATRLVLTGTQPLVITADGRRAGAAEELAAYTRLLGVSLVVASHPATLARALQHRTDGAPVLIDTGGANPFDDGQMDSIGALVATASALPVLVLPAGQDALEAAEAAAAFAATGVRHFIPTRLDLARRLGSVLAAAIAGSMALSEAGVGPGATDGLAPLTAALLAERLSHMPTAKRKRVPETRHAHT